MEKSAEVSRVSESRTLSPLSFSPFRIDFFLYDCKSRQSRF